jgi:hypothetical protein
MKNCFLILTLLCACFAVMNTGCSRKGDANAELQKAAKVFVDAEPTPEATPATPAPQTQSIRDNSGHTPAQQMSQAMADYKAGQLEDAVTRLQLLRAMPTMTPQQRIAMNDAMAAVMTDIYALAAKGDGRAIQAVKQYEKMQTRQR